MEATLAVPAATSTAAPARESAPRLKDLMEDGIYLLFVLRDGTAPHSAAELNDRVDQFLTRFERHALSFGKAPEAIQEAKYAFCAMMDEIILSSSFPIRDEWERNPLQLRLFGDHLAGEGFFDRLEQIRFDPVRNIEVYEVFYTCLLLGFQGKYLLEGSEKLGYLTARIGQEIASVHGGKAEFAPHWKPVFRFQAFVRHLLPVWVFYSILAAVAVLVFLLFTGVLGARASSLGAARAAADVPAAVHAV